jgi:Glycosyl-hydrolase 97 C-terminal, oligomerisation
MPVSVRGQENTNFQFSVNPKMLALFLPNYTSSPVNDARKIEISCSFLPEGKYQLEYYSDAADADKIPDHLTKQILTIRNTDKIPVALAAGGGTVMHVRPIK